jgi:hypothetical protein
MEPAVAKVIEELDAHRVQFETFCRSLTPAELDRPVPASTWVVRDFIAHLATIDGPVERMFLGVQAARTGEPASPGSGERWDVDRWNDSRVAERRARSIEEILAEAATARAALKQTLQQTTAQDLDYNMPFGGDSKRPATKVRFLSYLQGWCKHDPMHVADMLRAIPERRTPDVEQWLDDPVIAGYQRAMNT